jgi:hypothetical protein
MGSECATSLSAVPKFAQSIFELLTMQLIPMKERVVDIKYDPSRMFAGLLKREKRD